MHLDTSPRDNAKQALKDLAGIDRSTGWQAAAVGTVAGSPTAGVSRSTYARQKYDEFIESFSETPVLDQYEDPKGNGYNVPLGEKIRTELSRTESLMSIWRLYYPGKGK